MIEEILDSHRKMYKNNKNNIFSASQEKKTVDYDDDTEFILNQLTPNESFSSVSKRGMYNSKSMPNSIKFLINTITNMKNVLVV